MTHKLLLYLMEQIHVANIETLNALRRDHSHEGDILVAKAYGFCYDSNRDQKNVRDGDHRKLLGG